MLFKKMLRDMKENKMQFIAIFLMSFITLFIFAGVGAEIQGVQNNLQSYYNETNMADINIYGVDFSKDFVDNISNMSSTKDINRQFVIRSTANLDKSPTLSLHFVENNTVSQYYPVKGDNINYSDAEGIWLDARMAEEKNLSVGDNISFTLNGLTLNKTIRGIGYSPDYVYEESPDGLLPDFSLQGFAYLSEEAYPGNYIKYNKLLITTDDNADVYHEKMDKMIEDNGLNLTKSYSNFIPRQDIKSHSQIHSEIEQHVALSVFFPIVFVVVALLILLSTMTRIVNKQRTQIGTLKAIGFGNKSLIIHYLSYGLSMTLLGCILGMVIGYNTLPKIILIHMTSFYTLPSWEPGFNFSFIVVILLIVGGSMLFSYIAVRSIMKESPASTLKAKPPKVVKVGLLEKTKIWNKLSFNIRWNIRDMNRNRLRTIITVIGVIGSTVLLISAFGMQDSVDDLKDWKFEKINHYNNQLVLQDNVSQTQVDNIADEVNGSAVMFNPIKIEANGIRKTQKMTVFNKTPLITPTNKYMEQISLPEDGVAITQKTAELLDLKVGDIIKWSLYGNTTWINSTVEAIYAEPSNQGITITPKVLEDNNIEFKASEIVTKEPVTEDFDGVRKINTKDDLAYSWDKINEIIHIIISILLIFAIILAIVVLYSLGLLGFTEVERDMATLKVLGFQLKDLRKIFITQNLILSLVGFIIGVPVGYYVLHLIRNSVEKLYYPTHYNPVTIGICFIITIFMSVVVNLLLTQKLKNIDMVEALKKERD